MLYFNNTPYNNNIIKNVVKNEKYFKNNMLNIDDIFNIYTINKYEPNYELNNITTYEKKYIDLFIKRCNLFLNYLSHIQSLNIFNTFTKENISNFFPDIINIHWVNRSMISLKELNSFKEKILISMHDMWFLNSTQHYFKNKEVSKNLLSKSTLEYSINFPIKYAITMFGIKLSFCFG